MESIAIALSIGDTEPKRNEEAGRVELVLYHMYKV